MIWAKRGRLISVLDHSKAVELIDTPVASGARKFKPCEELGVTVRTYQRWTEAGSVKADGRAGRWGTIKALQRLLTRSLYGKLLAVKQVTENKGKRTPEVDGKIWLTPASKRKAIVQIRYRGYSPLLRLYILKSDGKKKCWLGIPCISDRGNGRGPTFLWIPALPLNRRCHRVMLHCSRYPKLSTMGFGR